MRREKESPLKVLLLLLVTVVPFIIPSADARQRDDALARQLANTGTRAETIRLMKSAPRKYISLLLEWSKRAPKQVDADALTEALIEAFGEFRVAEAVPFLVEHISDYTVICCVWTKTSESIIGKNPALRSLIQIGPQALPLLEKEYRRPLNVDGRIGVIFAIGQMKDKAAANFLWQARGAGLEQAHQAEEGLRHIGETAPPR